MASPSKFVRLFLAILVVSSACLCLSGARAGAPSNPPTSLNLFQYSQDGSRLIRHWFTRAGDDSSWSDPSVDPAGWERVADQPDGANEAGIRWFRTEIQLAGRQDELDILALSFYQTVSAFELYWDGEFVERCGVVGPSRAEEVPGPIRKTIPLRRDLTSPGRHVIALRLSNFHTDIERPMGYVALGYHYESLYSHSYKSSHRVIVGGAFLMTALFCMAMFFAGSRHRSYLLFAGFCLIRLFYDLYSILHLYNEINIAHLDWTTWLLRYGLVISNLMFVLFVVFTYDIRRKVIAVPLAVLLFVVSVGRKADLPQNHLLNSELLPAFAAGLLALALYRRAPGSAAALLGVIVWRLFKYPEMLPWTGEHHMYFYIFSDIFVLFCIVLSITRMIHEQSSQLHETRLRSARLEADLLKKNIQPHFILNTLQLVMNWTKSKPDQAFQVVEALAEEFRMVNAVADKALIPLHQEIDLCQTHLKIMGFRMGSVFRLESDGLCDQDQVPPLVFHTLIENALTHSFKTREDGRIHLSCEKTDRHTVYRFTNPGSRLTELASKPEDEIREGMGLRYVKARLAESYPDAWQLDYALTPEKWTVIIRLRH